MPLSTDTFTVGTDTALGSHPNWTAVLNNMMIEADTDDVYPNSASNHVGVMRDEDYALDQYAQAEVTAVSATGFAGVATRMSTNNYYGFYADNDAQYLFKIVAGSYTSLSETATGAGVAVSDVMYLQAIGRNASALIACINGEVAEFYYNDSDHDTGSVGLCGFGNSASDRVDNFRGSDFTGTDRVVVSQTRVSADTGGGSQQVDFSADFGDLIPRAVLLVGTVATADDTATAHVHLVGGMATSDVVLGVQNQVSWGFSARDGVSTTYTFDWGFEFVSYDRAIAFYDVTSDTTVIADASVGMGPGMVYLNWHTTPPSAYLITVVAIAGNDVLAACGTTSCPTTTNTATSLTTLGFESDLILGFTGTNGTASSHNNTVSFGVAKRDVNTITPLQYDLNTTTSSPPSSGEIRLNYDPGNYPGTASTMWIHETDRLSSDQSAELDKLTVGSWINVRDEVTPFNSASWEITSVTDSGTYRTIGLQYGWQSTDGSSVGWTTGQDLTLTVVPWQTSTGRYDRSSRTDFSEHHGGYPPIRNVGHFEPVSPTTNSNYFWRYENIDSQGFDLYNVQGTRSGRNFSWLALNMSKDDNYAAYLYTTPTTTGNDDDEGAGFEPQWVGYFTSLFEDQLTIYSDGERGSGNGISTITPNNAYSNYAVGEDLINLTSGTTNCNSISDDQAINVVDQTPAAELEATVGSILSTGVRLNFGVANNTVAKIWPAWAVEAQPTTTIQYIGSWVCELLGTTPITTTFDIGTRTNGLLVVGITMPNSTADPVTSVTWNSISMTEAAYDSTTSTLYRNYLFYKAGPTDGSNTLSIAFSGSNLGTTVTAAWFDNVDQSSPLDDTDSANGSSGVPSASLVPTANDELLVSVLAHGANDWLYPGRGKSPVRLFDVGGTQSAMSYDIQTTLASETMDWADGGADQWAVTAASFKAYAAGGLAARRYPRGVLRGVIRGSA